MAKPQTEKPRLSGSSRMTALGYKACLLWFTPEEHAIIKKAAEEEIRPMTGLIKFYAMLHARKIVSRSQRSGTAKGGK